MKYSLQEMVIGQEPSFKRLGFKKIQWQIEKNCPPLFDLLGRSFKVNRFRLIYWSQGQLDEKQIWVLGNMEEHGSTMPFFPIWIIPANMGLLNFLNVHRGWPTDYDII